MLSIIDPDATGVLPVCVGAATKACELLLDKDKEYEAVLLLGVETDTQDISGKVRKTRTVTVSEEEAINALMSFVGTYEQVPPCRVTQKEPVNRHQYFFKPSRRTEFFNLRKRMCPLLHALYRYEPAQGCYRNVKMFVPGAKRM